MIQHLEIVAGGEDVAAEQSRALQSGSLNAIIAHRMGHIAKGHSEAADDATGYAIMLAKIVQHFVQPIRDRTHGHATARELEGAATAAEKLAALAWAIADKARRDATRAAAIEAQQED